MSVFDAYIRLEGTVKGAVKCDEPMGLHTSYRIGGPAALFVECATLADLALTCEVLAEEGVEWTIIGKGTNLLVADEGYDGAVLLLSGEFNQIDFGDIEPDDESDAVILEKGMGYQVTAGAAAPLARLVQEAHTFGLSGLEYCVGIPGSVGGALAMNAGSKDEWISSTVSTLTVYELGEGLKSLRGKDIDWEYRSSGLASDQVIVEAVFNLIAQDKDLVSENMQERLDTRMQHQPLSAYSCGSVFKNPPGFSAGKLINSCGLAGSTCGDAQISELHANFILNNGSATAEDVITLMRRARDSVKERHGIRLTPEVKFLGFSL